MTSSQPKPRDFGRYLQVCRLNKGISLDAISDLTRITKACLKQIESEDMARLPSPVFVKGFLKAYAEAVGADKNEVLARYETNLAAVQQFEQVQTHLKRQSPFWRRFGIGLALLGVVILGTVYLAERFMMEDPGQDAGLSAEEEPALPPPTPLPHEEAGSDAKSQPPPQQATSEEEAGAATEKKALLTLKLSAVEPTWLKVIVDDQIPQEYNLDVGDKITLEARNGFNLLIGNAGGVDLAFNGKPVPVPGRSGQVVTLQLP